MSQITIRQLPEALEKQLRYISGRDNTSLNKTIIKLLMESLGMTANQKKLRSLDNLCGTWDRKAYREFLDNTENFNKIDPEVWK